MPGMDFSRWRQAVLTFLCFIGLIFGLTLQEPALPGSPTVPVLVKSSKGTLFPVAGLLKSRTSPPDPWTYLGPQGRYTLSNYRNPSVQLIWLATFLLTCMGDVFDAIASEGFKPDEPYPDGVYNCHLAYSFPSRSFVDFTLEMKKVDAPDWYMTFSDVTADLEALWFAALWFEDRVGFPEIDFEVHRNQRYSSGGRGPLFLASRGNIAYALSANSNASDA